VVDAGYVTGTSKMVRDQAEEFTPTDRDLYLTFDPPITSLGFDMFGAFEPGPSQASDGFGAIDRLSPTPDERFSFSLANSSGGFVGLVSDEPFASVRVNLGGRLTGFIDNISFSAPVPVPEPTTATLALATLSMAFSRRR